MYKRATARIIIVLAFCLLLPSTFAYGDVAYIPQNNFYETYQSKMQSLNRTFLVPDEHFATLVKDPRKSGDRNEIITVNAGAKLYVYYWCNYNDALWGYADYNYDFMENDSGIMVPTKSEDGWVELDLLEVIYDWVAFEEEYGHEFKDYDGNYSKVDDPQRIWTWTYPGSGETSGTIYLEDNETDLGSFYFSCTYSDPQGQEWGYCNYHRGVRNFWVCIDDPNNERIDAFYGNKTAYSWQPDAALVEQATVPYEASSLPSGDEADDLWIAIVLGVVILVAITAILIVVLWSSKRERESRGRQ